MTTFNFKTGLLLLLAGAMALASCKKDNYKTYAELKKEQKAAIANIVAKKGLNILSSFPKDGVFKENDFVVLDNGVYINVVSYGDSTRPIENQTPIGVRFSGYNYNSADSLIRFDLFANGTDPLEFTFGRIQYDNYAQCLLCQLYLSEGLESVLKADGLKDGRMLGHNAIVKLIVPFEVGSLAQSNRAIADFYAKPIYFDKVRFTFDN